MFLYIIRYKEDLVGLVVDEAPCVKLDELVSQNLPTQQCKF